MMKSAGFNIVRMAESAWPKLEPEKGRFDFQWMDKIINILNDKGIKVILGTPTAAPPKWLMDRNTDIYMRDIQGNDKRCP